MELSNNYLDNARQNILSHPSFNAYALFETINNNSPVLKFIEANNAFENILNVKFQPGEININQLFNSAYNNLLSEAINEVQQTGISKNINIEILSQNVQIEILYFEPKLIGFILYQPDNSSALFYKYIIDQIDEGIVIIDENGKILFSSLSFLKLFNLEDKNIINADFQEIIGRENFEKFEKNKHSQSFNIEFYNGHSLAQKTIKVKQSKINILNNHQSASKYTFTDITDHINAENQLKIAKYKAEESDRLKSSFLANMSHEIRTPMNGIIGFAELLGKQDIPIEKQKQYIQLIQNRSFDLLHLINDIIDIAKIDAGQVEVNLAEFNINDIFDDIIQHYECKLQKNIQKNIIIKKQYHFQNGEASIISDPVKIKQVVVNLIDNAIKFTDKGHIEIKYSLTESNEIQFSIKDTGIGIPADHQKYIFDRFRQINSPTKPLTSGTGLGLAICKSFIEMLNGNIWIHSQTGVGTEIYFTIPYRMASKKIISEKEQLLLDIDLTGRKVLIIEDDPASSLFLKEMIASLGAVVTTTDNCYKGLETHASNPFDFVLLDIQLPEMTGYEVARKMKAQNPSIPIIAQTAYTSLEDKKKCFQAGCDAYIRKPIELQDLYSAINKVLKINN